MLERYKLRYARFGLMYTFDFQQRFNSLSKKMVWLFHKEFYLTFPEAAKKFAGSDFVPLKSEYIDWYKSKGCHEKLVPVPKGGMVLWDSRTIHDNAAPVKGRKNPNKWRFVNFVSMTPAIWAHQDDYITKQKAYKELIASAHWSSQGVYLFPSTSNAVELKDHLKIEAVDKLPDIAQTYQSKLLAGIEKYDFDDGKSNGPNWRPLWLNKGKY
ncbi:hypothetical protein KUTeg_012226 [Tegillarca granosa]|uniref:Phytanoyl-CoA dioxygenase n=1 Tax=Tegillarca granosa TaxID=220873 RepID=A0ABQ9F2D6_TEGGR|nr:hypothetical protein KUTeg_012226 [Tegillarca granosa]